MSAGGPAGGIRYGTPNLAYLQAMWRTPPEADGPVYMVNLMKYRAVAAYAGAGEPARSGREADDLYAPTEILRDVGARVVFDGDVERQLLGQPAWDRVAVVRYPTRRSFIEMQRRGDFQEKHVHKDAGMEQTIVLGCLPAGQEAAAETPAAAAAGETVVVVHVLRFAPGGEAAQAEYGANVRDIAFAAGARPLASFAVEGTVIGDGREWDAVRFNGFPSLAAFEELVGDPRHRDAQPGRAAALADTCAVLVRPRLDRIGPAARADAEGRV